MDMSENKNLEDIKEFVLSIKDKPENIEYVNLLLTGFCQFDNLDDIKFLLFDSGINKEYLLDFSNNQPLRVAAKYDN